MSKNEEEIYSKSLSQIAWFRLKKNKLALFGLFLIGVAAFIAFMGPFIRPDKTPKANDQILEITTKKPGFTIELLKIRKNEELKQTSFWEAITDGTESEYITIPVYDYSFEGDNLVVEKYTGSDINNGQILK